MSIDLRDNDIVEIYITNKDSIVIEQKNITVAELKKYKNSEYIGKSELCCFKTIQE